LKAQQNIKPLQADCFGKNSQAPKNPAKKRRKHTKELKLSNKHAKTGLVVQKKATFTKANLDKFKNNCKASIKLSQNWNN
tara:strand:+ start:983 stop:1222 length:240 start_codon:yes stop_codon:yes gene_type:complete